MDLNPVYLSVPIVSMILDLLIFILPTPMIVTLNVNRRTKIVLYAIFAVSGVTIVTSAVRTWAAAARQVSAPQDGHPHASAQLLQTVHKTYWHTCMSSRKQLTAIESTGTQ